MFTPDLNRVPAPELTPDKMLTAIEFEMSGTDTFEEAQAEA